MCMRGIILSSVNHIKHCPRKHYDTHSEIKPHNTSKISAASIRENIEGLCDAELLLEKTSLCTINICTSKYPDTPWQLMY